MIITTTSTVDNHKIDEYKGIVFGEIITGINVLKDIGASFRDFFGGRSQGYEEELMNARQQAIEQLQQRASSIGANAVVGVKVDYETLGSTNNMIMIVASGTAVKINPTE